MDNVLSCTHNRKVSQYPNVINMSILNIVNEAFVVLAEQCVRTCLSVA